MSNFRYFLKEAFISFRRNVSTNLGAIVTIFLSLLVIGISMFGSIMVSRVVDNIESQVSITCYVADDAQQSDIDSLSRTISDYSEVSNVSFTTKDQALENFTNQMTSNPEIVDALDGANPLPASIDVELYNPQEVETVADRILEDSTFQKICDNPSDPSDSLKYGRQTVERLFKLTNYIRYIGIAVVALLVFVTFVFINNTIRLAILSRRKEIAIMRLVGASNGFIRGPFLMEGALQALFGSILAIIGIGLIRQFALPKIQSALSWMPLGVSGLQFLGISLALLVFGLIIGILGSMLAMRRYLKV
jgi:cell division transport system permease protein